ncbi:ADP-forming succinate--CoA ligase subunit beta [Emcibacteraceae bacterium]|jgi:succinyl-CoA synthetase beta subunit|uniref:ADP-forming succinate--CoA ligase subunit beta n=1 Tax=Pseudemcibacter sp. TaxID=2943293 RepID=UPI00230C80B4|nr:ADP-forming succinate--CoA ligase subunit beta [Kordiimonadaceae bacterium]MDA7568139.1 ADP-forming succinate--CoA ligase subunit beta [Emcibacteraceae bacterium]MDA9769709.1 ADP-forming succinate--CoA ligase subunit beta [Emcibacteraceae bacterium]MDC1089863.1 ADP-forming succinate--CoA ligase subunit beta [Emcibacteraceae bacterium]MDG1020532.1 ADP-forming succinate--CoA ligase subunit beta [Emcibacteraceae bacterium]
MNIHEYQAKALLKEYGASVLGGGIAYTADEAEQVAKDLGGPVWVVKAQIHAGGRGKGGGVKVVKSVEDVKQVASEMIGMNLVTHQTGPAGKEVNQVYIEDGCAIANELYVSIVVDRESSRVAIIASSEGGMDIEEVAAEAPEKIITVTIDPASGLSGFHCRKVAFGMGLTGKAAGGVAKVIAALYKAFMDKDAAMLEINPLVVTEDDDVVVLDAKMGFDGNSLYRHKDVQELRDPTEEDPMELEAAKHELNYIKLDGSIGCMVNGAGLAMSTMDIIKLKGGSPANFLDVGGGATRERVTEAFKIIMSDPNVEGILVNIFGGIMRCDVIAEGVVAAAKELSLTVPLIVRLEGTNVEKGKEIMANSGINIISASDLGDAAVKAVAAVKEAK